ncbi:MAG TPA: acetate--CoA ligase [Methylomirabilota bacterium]|nr:acetate--CoA ligase [Methylomirabilota bacterium]
MAETGTSEIVWRPTKEYAERSRIARFMRAQKIASLEELQRRSIEDPEWYWDAVVRDLGVRFTRPYTRVRDVSRGIQWARWFPGGLMNFADNCVDRNLDAGRGDQPAIIWEGDDGQSRTLGYRELAREVNRLANALKRLGIGEGDRVGVFLPMSPEAAIATLAVVRIGAIYTPCFSGYGAQAVASRLQDCEAKLLITADGFYRRGAVVPMKETADEAVAMSPSVQHVIVYRRLGRDIPWAAGRDLWWHDLVAKEPDRCDALAVDADRPCLIIYTSGTTGRPKGAVLTHGGFLVKCAHDFGYLMDVGPGDRLFWLTDLGWLMGPMLITAGLFHGGTAVVFEGVPDYPKPDRLWALAERHKVTVMGLSPTAVRALMPHGPEHVHAHDLSSLRILGSTGEPWNPEPYRWLFENAGKARVPIINYTGGTEISGGILGCFPIAPIKPCSFAGPIPGMAADCFGEDGKPVRGQVGELVVKAPWPGMTQGFWKDPERYEDTYWSRWKDVWVHGDWAYVDADGFWFIQGRSDDTLKIAGKRLGPAEVESVLVGHPAVAEAGVIGVPHAVKGEAIVCFVVLRPGETPGDALRAELVERVAHQMGKALKPERVLFTRDLPKTRSAKIMRRVIRATYLGKEPGDLSSLENPAAVTAITEAR